MLERRQEPKRVGVVVEAADLRSGSAERLFAGMTERGMPQIMRETERFGEVVIDREHARNGTGDLRDFEGMGEACAVIIAFMMHEDLCLVLQTAEGRRMD